jgi:hypothetical protein
MSLSAVTLISLSKSAFILLALLGSLVGVGATLAISFHVLSWFLRGRRGRGAPVA